MQFKTYIVIFFTAIFLGKFLVLDARMLHSVMDAEGIALINPFCKKSAQQTTDDILSQDSSVLVISSDAVCNSFFYFSSPYLPGQEIKNNFHDFNYQNPAVISSYFSKDYPPPKALVTYMI
ncbi:hypothetical protein [Salegentibacter maritimus]|uniref:hypothetical protein n=1 Tax=Salegentibacter maritimus TaxID=2794347 RepID=UPI0018E4BDEF|nr:hypothetical protein [Salegentibacter maritimus]MBI6115410.1 hypothetical protein [Salegentibacter maritimus]